MSNIPEKQQRLGFLHFEKERRNANSLDDLNWAHTFVNKNNLHWFLMVLREQATSFGINLAKELGLDNNARILYRDNAGIKEPSSGKS